jgi:hypothetical protein
VSKSTKNRNEGEVGQIHQNGKKNDQKSWNLTAFAIVSLIAQGEL